MGPTWLALRAGELFGMPGDNDVGTHDVVLMVVNNKGVSAEQCFKIQVEK